jgi:dienelactone hydrolase
VTIAPNVRGSDGYGKTYIKLDNGPKRQDSVKDIGALLDWIATQPDLDKDRVVVYGGSYGGFMVLASLAAYSDRLAGAVDIVGISNFTTFLTNTEGYRRDLRRAEYGDERDPAMKKIFDQISPLNLTSGMKKPLFVIQGRNDPRVPWTEAEQIVSAVRGQGGEVWYMLAGDEGHGFRKKQNIDAQREAETMFFSKVFGRWPLPTGPNSGPGRDLQLVGDVEGQIERAGLVPGNRQVQPLDIDAIAVAEGGGRGPGILCDQGDDLAAILFRSDQGQVPVPLDENLGPAGLGGLLYEGLDPAGGGIQGVGGGHGGLDQQDGGAGVRPVGAADQAVDHGLVKTPDHLFAQAQRDGRIAGGGLDQVAQGGLQFIPPLAGVAGVADDIDQDDQVVRSLSQDTGRGPGGVEFLAPRSGDDDLADIAVLGQDRPGGQKQGCGHQACQRSCHGRALLCGQQGCTRADAKSSLWTVQPLSAWHRAWSS